MPVWNKMTVPQSSCPKNYDEVLFPLFFLPRSPAFQENCKLPKRVQSKIVELTSVFLFAHKASTWSIRGEQESPGSSIHGSNPLGLICSPRSSVKMLHL